MWLIWIAIETIVVTTVAKVVGDALNNNDDSNE
jgi:hypothetical protein